MRIAARLIILSSSRLVCDDVYETRFQKINYAYAKPDKAYGFAYAVEKNITDERKLRDIVCPRLRSNWALDLVAESELKAGLGVKLRMALVSKIKVRKKKKKWKIETEPKLKVWPRSLMLRLLYPPGFVPDLDHVFVARARASQMYKSRLSLQRGGYGQRTGTPMSGAERASTSTTGIPILMDNTRVKLKSLTKREEELIVQFLRDARMKGYHEKKMRYYKKDEPKNFACTIDSTIQMRSLHRNTSETFATFMRWTRERRVCLFLLFPDPVQFTEHTSSVIGFS
ncbi:hypothetical protein EVAR_12188_1 [Eumeta japonica]|uniref:Uncharacterized protein n=1 Tax=Eumeta variegata TaxID=151549 RepID=A0A4C1UHC2_EUMVA|nr:hypothetical protein EVAR_12188_1 [Eumeta japonica]